MAFGFFGRRKISANMYLNGEIVLSTDKMQMNEHSEKYENWHSNGFVVGTTYFDFMVLPANSRIWFTAENAEGSEAFLRLVKL